MMTYQQFKDYLARFVWRDGDTAFEADLDNLIAMGEARLNRDLRLRIMETTTTVSATERLVDLPDDYLELRRVSGPRGALHFVTPQEAASEATGAAFPQLVGTYTIEGRKLALHGPQSVTEPIGLVLVYYARVPDFKTDDTSWLADLYLDLYTYAVLRHTASYLRDDERVALWQNEYATTLESVMQDELKARYAGSPLTVRLPGAVA